jgi:hypothetical protein
MSSGGRHASAVLVDNVPGVPSVFEETLVRARGSETAVLRGITSFKRLRSLAAVDVVRTAGRDLH